MNRFRDPENLTRMRMLMKKLGDPQKDLRFIHVGGTNGKGSVSRYIYEALEAAGYRAGIFTSPFIERFNERIEANHEMISDSDLDRITDRVMKTVSDLRRELEDEGVLGEGESPVTEFDVITAVAFIYFKETEADPVVLEVGLGGRGDSTNVIEAPLACVITSIGLDHTDRLGNSIEEIAMEKAGIIKPGRPVISSALQEEARAVIREKAGEKGAEFLDVSGHDPAVLSQSAEGTEFILGDGKRYGISMAGPHQVRNAVTAISAINRLNESGDIKIPEEALKKGLLGARQPGRMEIVKTDGPIIVLDGAHNPQGGQALKDACGVLFGGKRILLVTAMMRDKDIHGLLRQFSSFADEFIFTATKGSRSANPEDLLKAGNYLGIPSYTAACPESSVNKALERDDFDVIIFAGSLYLIGEVRTLLKEKGFLEEER